jgi:hypothetical protein
MKLVLAFNERKTWFKKKFVFHVGKILTATCIVIALVSMSKATEFTTKNVYPQGKQFPLALYSIHTPQEMGATRQSGWNIAHTYQFTPSFLQTVEKGGMFALANLPGESEPIPEVQAAHTIAALAKSDLIAWWNFPEERRYWRAGEMALIVNYANWTRKYDPKKRPNYMYIPGHYDNEDIEQYVPYLDVIPASVYPTYADMPHAWVRWRMETTVNGIKLAQAKIGSNYFKGEKTPVAVLELFNEQGNSVITPEAAYHDFWQSIISGARGILIFSYWHKRDHPNLERVWQMYNKAAKEIVGSEKLGSVILFGKRIKNVSFQITKGPGTTNEFKVDGMTEPLSFPSIDILTLVWNQHTYVIAVNSAQQPVSARLTGLVQTATQATVLFENRTVPVSKGAVNTDFKPLGVHIFKIAS